MDLSNMYNKIATSTDTAVSYSYGGIPVLSYTLMGVSIYLLSRILFSNDDDSSFINLTTSYQSGGKKNTKKHKEKINKSRRNKLK